MVGGYGCSKTFSLALFSIKHSMIDNGLIHQYVSPNFGMAKKTIIPTIFDIFENRMNPAMVEGVDFKYNRSDHFFEVMKWNGKISICSGSVPSSLNGPTVASFAIDEPGQQKKEVWIKMIARLREPRAKALQGAIAGTPEGLNWFYDLCEGDKKPIGLELIRAKTRDNINLPVDYIDNMMQQYDPQLVLSYIEGIFVPLESGTAYHCFGEQNIIENFEYNPNELLIIGMDFNYDPMTAIVAQEAKINGKYRLVVFDEFFRRNCTTNAICEMIIDKYGRRAEYSIYPDPACRNRSAHGDAGRSDLAIIKTIFNGLNFYVKQPIDVIYRKDRLNAVNGLLKNAMGEINCYVTRGLKHLCDDLRKITMEEYLNDCYKDKSLGHITDALGYVIAQRNPIKIDRNYYREAA